MKVIHCIFILALLSMAYTDSCEVQESLKSDCGYVGVTQALCEAKQCCWKPASETEFPQDTPWCFYPAGANPCQNITYSGADGPGFDDQFYQKMNTLFEANINIQGKGGIVASPDPNTPGGSYYFHWMRDAALTMRTYMEVNELKLSVIEEKMKAYVGWVKRVQGLTDPNGFDIRINPKFELPEGGAYVGGWCRPQTDGPGLRAATLIIFANVLIAQGQSSYVTSDLIPTIKKDLEWIYTNWSSSGCDLWEEVRSDDFFWNRASFVYALDIGQKFFESQGDSATASQCSSTKSAVAATLEGHWTGSFYKESSNREKDGAVVHAISSFNVFSLTDDKVAKTMRTLALTFCSEYQINQNDTKAGEPGVLIGRYPGDSYAGGNPWQLLTAVFAKTFYQGASVALTQNGFADQEDKQSWYDLLQLPADATIEQFAESAVSAGDAVMTRLYKYVKIDGGHISEQIDKNLGGQKSAHDLTWSYANILSAMKTRKASVEMIQHRQVLSEE